MAGSRVSGPLSKQLSVISNNLYSLNPLIYRGQGYTRHTTPYSYRHNLSVTPRAPLPTHRGPAVLVQILEMIRNKPVTRTEMRQP